VWATAPVTQQTLRHPIGDNHGTARRHRWISRVRSTGQRNVECFSRSRKVQGFAGSFVKLAGDRVELPLAEAIDGLALGEVLTQ